MNCDPKSLADAARCFSSCIPHGEFEAVKIYLICEFANKNVGPVAPAVPGNIDISDASGIGATIITWTNSDVPLTNEVWRSKNGAAFVLLATVAGAVNNITDGDAMPANNQWTYKVRACNGVVCSAFSSTVSAANTIHPAAGGPAPLPDLVLVYGDFDESNDPAVVTISQPLLRSVGGVFKVSSSNFLNSVTCNSLKSVGGSLFLDSASISSFSANSLATVGGDASFGGTLLVNFSLPALVSVGGDCTITSNALLTTISLPALTTLSGNMDWDTNAVLANTNLASFVITDGATIDWSNCAIVAGNSLAGTGINGILHRGVVSGTTVSIYALAGGTNAAPTGQGIVDKATLIGAGNTVNTN